MSATTLSLPDEAATERAGGALAGVFAERHIEPRASAWVVYLHGPLGAGKTTLVRGFLRALGQSGAVKSPTYTLVEPYELPARAARAGVHVFHFDLYRLIDPEELEMLGLRDLLGDPLGVCLVEWPEKGAGVLPEPDVILCLDYAHSGRTLAVRAASGRGGLLLGELEWPQ